LLGIICWGTRLKMLNPDLIPKRCKGTALQDASRGSRAKGEPRGFGVRQSLTFHSATPPQIIDIL
jgi:hypothetical protein